MITFIILTTTFLTAVAVAMWPERSRALPASNVFGSIVLPTIDDPDWQACAERGCWVDGCTIRGHRLGSVMTCMEHGVVVDAFDLAYTQNKEACKAYARAVREAYIQAAALRSIEGLPALPPWKESS